MLYKGIVLSNQKLIDTALRKIKPSVINTSHNAQDYFYRKSSAELTGICEKGLRDELLTFQEYCEIIEKLLACLTQSRRVNQAVEQQICLDSLLYLHTFIDKALLVLENKPSYQQNLEILNYYQKMIEGRIKLAFDTDFKLHKPFILSGISQEYKDTYEREYGHGALGFFKLPVKGFLQHNNRSSELKFLENVDYYCQTTASLSDTKKNQFMVSAATLVVMSIINEGLEKNSVLVKILSNRYVESGQGLHLQGLDRQFLDQCNDRNIKVPEHLASYYMAELKAKGAANQNLTGLAD